MSLKQKIENSYTDWEKKSKEMVKSIGQSSSNYKTVLPKVKKLKDDLCKFADSFDNYIKTMSESYDKPLSPTIVDDMYKNIKENFVGRIAKEKNNYIYVDGKTKPLADTIKEYAPAYKYLESEFTKSYNLASFFDKAYEKFALLEEYDYDEGADNLNYYLTSFISSTLNYIEQELNRVTKFLVAKDEDFFRSKKSCSFFSRKVFRKLFPRAWSAYQNRKKYNKHMLEKVKTDVKIFPQGKPLPSEVRQGVIGDCYLISALISLAKTNPKAIEDCFVQGLDKIEKEENIDIRFFSRTNSVTSKVVIRVNKKTVIDPKAIKDGALWPKLIEKAYAVYRKKGYEDNSKKNLHGGLSYNVMFAITGKKMFTHLAPGIAAALNRSSPAPKEKFNDENIIATIKRKLGKSKSLTCSFKKKIKIKDVKSKEKIQIYDNHEYAIVGVNESQKYIRIINPWKSGGRKIENSPKSKEGGHIAMSFDDFKKNSIWIDYTSKKDA